MLETRAAHSEAFFSAGGSQDNVVAIVDPTKRR
jgi:hypothetical protein